MFEFLKKDKTDTGEWIENLSGLISDSVREKVLGDAMAHADEQITEVLKSQDSICTLKAAIVELKEELAGVKSKKRLEEAEFKALIKLREDRQALDIEKKELALEKDYNSKEMDLLKTGHEQHVKAIEEQSKRLDKFMKDAMDCLKTATAPATVVK